MYMYPPQQSRSNEPLLSRARVFEITRLNESNVHFFILFITVCKDFREWMLSDCMNVAIGLKTTWRETRLHEVYHHDVMYQHFHTVVT